MKTKFIVTGISLLLGNLVLMHPAEAVSPHKCPKEVKAKANIRLTKQYPHFRINWGVVDDPNDNFYEVCKAKISGNTFKYYGCKRITEYTPYDGKGLYIIGTQGRNGIRGTQNDDIICGLGGNDVIKGGGGDDYIYGNGGKDYLMGSEGDDHIYGGNGKDTIYGLDEAHENLDNIDLDRNAPNWESDQDYLYGGNGKDYLSGGPEDDVLEGQNGKDRMNGGEGLDQINGGNGKDTCVDIDQDSGLNGTGAAVDECANSNAADQ